MLSRLALLDIFVAFFLLCGVACLVNDRDWYRARMARLLPAGRVTDARSWGPVRGLLFRPWLLAGGVCFGLALGTKWTALYPLAAFGVLVWVWSAGARRSFGVRWPRAAARRWSTASRRSCTSCVVGAASSTSRPGPAG